MVRELLGSASQPILILRKESSCFLGRDIQYQNIMTAILAAKTMKLSSGSKDMDKILVNPFVDTTMMNDDQPIVRNLDIFEPIAVKKQSLGSVSEAVSMFLKVDGLIAFKDEGCGF